jgi:CRP/FNR family cyclic AMP-dependent transcriptional regulator
LDEAQLEQVSEHLQPRAFPAGAVFIRQGQSAGGLFFLREGSVKVFLPHTETAARHSKEVVIAVCGAGETLGEIDLADGQGHTASVAALEDCHLWWMEGEDFWRCHEAIPRLGRNLCQLLARRMRWCTTAQDSLATLHLPGKVAYCLLLLARDYGKPQPGGALLLPLHLSQSEIAGMIGSSRECVNRVFADFKKRGVIQLCPRKQVMIRGVAALHGYCEDLLPDCTALSEADIR